MMEPFKFTDTGNGLTYFDGGEALTGYTSFSWTERYRRPGEFELKAPLSSGLRTRLPIGSLISHVETLEVAIVENLQIDDGDDPMLTFTGRSFETFWENRVVGSRLGYGDPTPPMTPYVLSSDHVAAQAVQLITDHNDSTPDVNESVPHVVAVTDISSEGVLEARTLKRDNLHKTLLELLSVNDYGIRVLRRNPFGVLGNNTTTELYIHKGVNRASDVIFSWSTGDLKGAKYLWSNKSEYNTAYVVGKWVEEFVYTGFTAFDRRVLLVNAADLDEEWSTAPTGTDLTTIRSKMNVRGQQALANQNEVNITDVEISETSEYRYRRDYDIGDFVSIDGNFGEIEPRRVVAHTEIEDERGETSFPTLEAIPTTAIL